MQHASVILRHHGSVVDARVVPLREGGVMGDAVGAVPSFPGGVLRLHRDARGSWYVGGTLLEVGRAATFRFGAVEVEVEGVVEPPLRDPLHGLVDPRAAVLATAALLLVMAIDAAHRVLDDHPDLAAGLQALVLGDPR